MAIPLYLTFTCPNTLGQCGPESSGNEGVICIFLSSRTGASQANSLVPYKDTRWEESYPYAEMQSIYSTTPDDRVPQSKNQREAGT